ncbi:unnamed protein product, partial [Rotaria magnacalcarata]
PPPFSARIPAAPPFWPLPVSRAARAAGPVFPINRSRDCTARTVPAGTAPPPCSPAALGIPAEARALWKQPLQPLPKDPVVNCRSRCSNGP